VPGPLPKRIEERRRQNKVPGEVTVAMVGAVRPPPVPRRIHPQAAAWYRSLARSGQSQFFEPSDWAAAGFVCHLITKALEAEATAAQASAAWAAMSELLTSEAARRKAHVFVQRTAAEVAPEKPTAIEEYRKVLAK
jgi:hypothetical protein